MRRRALFLSAPLLWGCANNSLVRFETLEKQAASQDFTAAARYIQKEHDLYGSHSELLYNMDLGVVYHYAGRYDSSIVFLQRAVKIKDALYAHSVTNEAASLLVNDNIRPYRGKNYEITWLHLFLAFDYLALNRFDDARVEVRQAEILLKETRRKAGSDASAYRDDGLFRTTAALIYEALGEKDDALISLYQAVKVYREVKQPVPQALARYAYTTLTANGREDDAKDLNLSAIAPTPDEPSFGGSEIVVVGEMGRSPTLGETQFWGTWVRDGVLVYHYRDADGKEVTDALPAPGLPQSEYEKGRGQRTRSGTTLHVKWAMPALQEVSSQSTTLRVAQGSRVYSGESFADTRDLLRQDLKENHTSVLTRTVIRVVLRTLTAQQTKNALNTDNPLINLLTNIGTDALADQLEQADTRDCFLLPRTLQLVRIPVKPGHYSLELGAENGNGKTLRTETREIDVRAGEKKFVFFTSLK